MHCLDAKSFTCASLGAAAHLWMQFKILLSNQARHQMKVHSGFKHLQTKYSCLLSLASPTQPENSGTVPKPIPLPQSLPGQQSKVT